MSTCETVVDLGLNVWRIINDQAPYLTSRLSSHNKYSTSDAYFLEDL